MSAAAPLLGLVAEVRPGDALLQVLECAEILDDVAARVVEEDLALLVAAAGAKPLEVVAILEQVVDGLGDAPPGNDGDLRARGPLRLLGHVRSSQYELCHRFNVISLGEEVDRLHAGDPVAPAGELPGVPGEGGGVARDIEEAGRAQPGKRGDHLGGTGAG